MNSSSSPSASIPQHCPGTQSAEAGRAAPCAGCPNQSICASGEATAAQEETRRDILAITENLSLVKHIILVMSGKGGVGKSTVASQLALLLAERAVRDDSFVGLLDVDVCGPSQAHMLGVSGEHMAQSQNGDLQPIYAGPHGNLLLASVDCLLPLEEGEGVVWRGPRKSGLIRTLLKDVQWSSLQFLVVDTPPGTSDEHLTLARYLINKPPINKDDDTDRSPCYFSVSSILVTGPQEMAWQDVRKQIDFCKKVALPVSGIIQNMSGPFQCPACHVCSPVFPQVTSMAAWARVLNIPFVSIPIDPGLARAVDSGMPYVLQSHKEENDKDAEVPPVSLAYQKIISVMLKE